MISGTRFSLRNTNKANVNKPEESLETDLSVGRIIINFLTLAIPTMVSCLFLQLTNFANIYFAGKLDNSASLAGVGLGISWFNVVCFSVLMGMNGA